jgi:hypothetical protein
MEAIALFLILVVGLAIFTGASLRWHPDTRERWPGDAAS